MENQYNFEEITEQEKENLIYEKNVVCFVCENDFASENLYPFCSQKCKQKLCLNCKNFCVHPLYFYFCRTCYLQNEKELKEQNYINIQKYNDNFQVSLNEIVKDKIFLGNEFASKQKNLLKELGITHILVAGCWMEQNFKEDFCYKKLEIQDTLDQNLKGYFEEVFDFIEKAEKILVHCSQGKSRSVSFVIFYLMKKWGIGYDEAFLYVKKRRAIAQPNQNFEKQLRQI